MGSRTEPGRNDRTCRIPGDRFRCPITRHGPPRVICRIDLYEIEIKGAYGASAAGGAPRRPRRKLAEHANGITQGSKNGRRDPERG
jgi:hypothetical protein